MKSHDLENFLNLCELYWGPLPVNTTLGMSCHANILLLWILTVSDETFGSLGQSIWDGPHIYCYKAEFSLVGKLNLYILTEKKSLS